MTQLNYSATHVLARGAANRSNNTPCPKHIWHDAWRSPPPDLAKFKEAQENQDAHARCMQECKVATGVLDLETMLYAILYQDAQLKGQADNEGMLQQLTLHTTSMLYPANVRIDGS